MDRYEEKQLIRDSLESQQTSVVSRGQVWSRGLVCGLLLVAACFVILFTISSYVIVQQFKQQTRLDQLEDSIVRMEKELSRMGIKLVNM